MEARRVLGDGAIIKVLQEAATILGDPESRQCVEMPARRLARQAGCEQYIPGTFIIQAALQLAWQNELPELINQQGRSYFEELVQEIFEIESQLHKAMVFATADESYRWFFGYAAINHLRLQILAQHPVIVEA